MDVKDHANGMRWSLYRYRAALSKAGAVPQVPDPRTGWLVRLAVPGAEAWGEVAPLPGYSPENPETCEQELLERLPVLTREGFSMAPGGWAVPDGSPSVRFGLETARCGLVARSTGRSVCALLGGPEDPPPLPVNALLSMASSEACLADADRSVARGFRCLKMKVGRADPEDEVRRVRQVRERVAGRARLRLDANRAWTLEQAVYFMEGVGDTAIDYLEEPLADLKDLPALLQRRLLPVALDESLPELKDLPAGLAAVVLKPTLLGGFSACRELAAQAEGVAAVPVVSALFETGVGLRAAARLATAISPQGTAAGLDTHRRLRDDLLAFAWPESRGTLDMQALERGPEAPTMNNLELVAHG